MQSITNQALWLIVEAVANRDVDFEDHPWRWNSIPQAHSDDSERNIRALHLSMALDPTEKGVGLAETFECPECGSPDGEDAGWTPMDGPVTECPDCGNVWNRGEDGPENDNWITRGR